MDPHIARCDTRTRHADLYAAVSPQTIEHQAQLLLLALVYATHPRAVLEVGVYRAETTLALYRAQVLLSADDAVFHLDAVEIDRAACMAARDRLYGQGGGLWGRGEVAVYEADFLTWHNPRLYDIALIDADWNNRHAEYQHVTPMMHPGGLILTHDTGDASPGRSGTLRAIAEAGHQHLDLALPRGLIVSQVPW